MEYLTRRCQDLLNDSNRVLYQMLYIHLDQRYLERISNREELGNFFREMVKILQEYMDKDDVLARVSDQGFAVLRRSAGERASLEWLLRPCTASGIFRRAARPAARLPEYIS